MSSLGEGCLKKVTSFNFLQLPSTSFTSFTSFTWCRMGRNPLHRWNATAPTFKRHLAPFAHFVGFYLRVFLQFRSCLKVCDMKTELSQYRARTLLTLPSPTSWGTLRVLEGLKTLPLGCLSGDHGGVGHMMSDVLRLFLSQRGAPYVALASLRPWITVRMVD